MNIKACPLCGAELITVEYHHNELIGTCRCGLDFRIKADKPTEIWNNRPVEDELKRMLNEELSKQQDPQEMPFEITCKENERITNEEWKKITPGETYLVLRSGEPITMRKYE